jgi:hypothetical protein
MSHPDFKRNLILPPHPFDVARDRKTVNHRKRRQQNELREPVPAA